MAITNVRMTRVVRCSRHVRHIHAMPRRYGGRLLFVLGVVVRLTLTRNIRNLDQINHLSDARDALDTFDGDLPQVKRRHTALNRHDASLDADLQCPMRPVATLVEKTFHPLKQTAICLSGIRQFVRCHLKLSSRGCR